MYDSDAPGGEPEGCVALVPSASLLHFEPEAVHKLNYSDFFLFVYRRSHRRGRRATIQMRPGVRIRVSRWCRARRRCTATWRRCWRGREICCRWSRPPGRPTATPATAWPATSPSGERESVAVLFVPTPLRLPPHGAHKLSNCRPYRNSQCRSSTPPNSFIISFSEGCLRAQEIAECCSFHT